MGVLPHPPPLPLPHPESIIHSKETLNDSRPWFRTNRHANNRVQHFKCYPTPPKEIVFERGYKDDKATPPPPPLPQAVRFDITSHRWHVMTCQRYISREHVPSKMAANFARTKFRNLFTHLKSKEFRKYLCRYVGDIYILPDPESFWKITWLIPCKLLSFFQYGKLSGFKFVVELSCDAWRLQIAGWYLINGCINYCFLLFGWHAALLGTR